MAVNGKTGERVLKTVEEAAHRREAKFAAGAATVGAATGAAAVAVRHLTRESEDAERLSGPSRKYRLRRREPLAYGVRRVAVGRLENAVERLRDPDADEVEAVHEARKDVKKLRSVLRLVRPVIGDDAYRRENQLYRDAARRISGVRDAQALDETVDALEERFGDESPPEGWPAIRAALSAAGSPNGDVDVAELRERVAEEIEAGRRRLENLGLPGKGFEVVEPGLRRAYSRGRARLRDAEAEPTDERLHEWRKRTKDVWHHLRLLRPGWRPVLEPHADQAHELSNLLGDDHDLVVLTEHLDDHGVALSGEQRERLTELIRKRRSELQEKAFALGERLFAEKPKGFARRLRRYWEAERV